MMERREFFDRFLFVRKCGGCGEILAYERCHEAFCSICARSWYQAKAENCPDCLRVVTECTCAPKGLKGVRSLRKIIFYHARKQNEPQNKLIYFLKHRKNRRMFEFVAKELESSLLSEIADSGFATRKDDVVLVNVPRGNRAKTKYGFDQSEQIARAIEKRCGFSYLACLGRYRGGKEQKKLTGAKRFQNVSGKFYLKEEVDLSDKCVVLFDDIVTTGASMSGCVPLLRGAGAKEILAFCIAQD